MSCGDLLGDAAWDQLAQHRVQSAGDLGPGAAEVAVALGPHLQHRRVIVGLDLAAGGERSAATATDRASLGSFLFTAPFASSRTRAPSLGCTSRTRSPAASSCWASR